MSETPKVKVVDTPHVKVVNTPHVRIKGKPRVKVVNTPTVITSVSGDVVTISGNIIQISGQAVITDSGSVTSISGNIVQTSISGNIVQTSISGNIVQTNVSGNIVQVSGQITTPENRGAFITESIRDLPIACSGFTQLPNISVPNGFAIVIRATVGNTGNVFVSNSGNNTCLASGRITLAGGDVTRLFITNANLAFVAASTSGQNVDIIVEQ